MSYFILMGRRIPKQAITGFKFQEDEFYEGIENEEKAKEKSREWYLNWINYMREQIK